MHFAKSKKPDPKGYLLCDYIYMIFWKRQSYRYEKKIKKKNRSVDGGGRIDYKWPHKEIFRKIKLLTLAEAGSWVYRTL